jgi:hypothetical protein
MMQPTTSVKELGSTAHLNEGFQQSFRRKQVMMQRHLYR